MNSTISWSKLDAAPRGGRGPFDAVALWGEDRLPGLVLLHGRNSNPDGAVVGLLRRKLNEDGYSTLSLANPLPSGGDEFSDYVKDLDGERYVFSEAAARLRSALCALEEHGIRNAVLLGFSMGARLISAFLTDSQPTAVPVKGFIAVSIGVNGPGPLNSATTLPKVRVPVLEICGEGDADVAKSAPIRKAAYESGSGPSYMQVVLRGSVPHNLSGAENELVRHVRAWLSGLL